MVYRCSSFISDEPVDWRPRPPMKCVTVVRPIRVTLMFNHSFFPYFYRKGQKVRNFAFRFLYVVFFCSRAS